MKTNNGKKGGLLKGKPHYDKSGKPMGGIKAVVTDSGQQVELEGGEVIINKEASKKHWKELSRINQSAGGGVPILPPDEDDGGDEFADGGRTIEFNPNHLPNRWVYQYAKRIKEKYPKVWAMGGNIFGNEAFKNLERALKRGYWTDSEKWMYIKWQSFNARHSGDIRIAGIIANLKWLNKVDKGWDYMKQLIEAEIDKKYGDNKMAKGGELAKGIKVEKEHIKTAEKLYNRKITPEQSFREIAKDHLKEDSHYYTKLNKFESKMAKGGFIGLPSTDSKTWDAEYEVGDKVRIRKDFEANSPILTINYVQIEKQMKRPENPKGKLYKLSNGQNWEGKDLEPADNSQVSGQTATQSKPRSNFVGTFMDNIDIIRQLITDGGTFKTTVDTSTVGFPRYFMIKPQTSGSDLVEIKCYEEDLQSSNIILYPEHWVQWYIFKNIWVADLTEAIGTSTPNQASKQKPTKQAKEPIVQYDYGAGLREFIINNIQSSEETTLEEQKHLIVSIFDKIKK